MSVSLVGTWIQIVVQSWLVFQLTNSSFLLGLVGFLGTFPVFLFSLPAGVLADRLNKKDILIFTQSLFMVLAIILGILTQLKIITPFQIMLIVLLNGIVMAFDGPSRQAIVMEMVGNKHLLNAVALNSISFNASRVIGPALAGILVGSIGMAGCFYLNAVSFLAVIFSLLVIKLEKVKSNRRNISQLQDLKEGIIYIKDNPFVFMLILIVGIFSLFGISYNILMPVFARNILKTDAKGLGILMSSNGLGALLAGLLLAHLTGFRYKIRLLTFCSFLFSFSLILFSFTKTFLFSMLCLVFLGGWGLMVVALVNTLLQSCVEDEFRGRVMGVFMFILIGLMPFGNLFIGYLSQKLGVNLALFINGIICFILYSIINRLIFKITCKSLTGKCIDLDKI